MSSEDENVFHDSPLEIQAKINEYLSKNSLTKAAFARTLNITSNALSRFLTSPEPRADNQTYEEAYCFFERLRKKNNEPRQKKRRIDGEAMAAAAAAAAAGGNSALAQALAQQAASHAAATQAAQQAHEAELEARDRAHRVNMRTLQLLVRHYGLQALLRGPHMLTAAAFFGELFGDYNDLDKRAKAVVACVFDDLTLLEEVLCTVKLDVVTRTYPFLLEPHEPKNPFTVCFFEVPRNGRSVRQTAEAQYCNDVEFYRGFQRLRSDVEQFAAWSSEDVFRKPRPERRYAPLGPPPKSISFQPDKLDWQDNEKRDTMRFESELNTDHSACCHNRMRDFAHVYDQSSAPVAKPPQ